MSIPKLAMVECCVSLADKISSACFAFRTSILEATRRIKGLEVSNPSHIHCHDFNIKTRPSLLFACFLIPLPYSTLHVRVYFAQWPDTYYTTTEMRLSTTIVT